MRFLPPEHEEEGGINLMPLVDVIFLLLIFFMVTTQFVEPKRRLDILLPEAEAAIEQQKKEQFNIGIKPGGRFFLDGKAISRSALRKKLLSSKGRPNRVAVIEADKRVIHQQVVDVLSLCRLANINEVGIAVK